MHDERKERRDGTATEAGGDVNEGDIGSDKNECETLQGNHRIRGGYCETDGFYGGTSSRRGICVLLVLQIGEEGLDDEFIG